MLDLDLQYDRRVFDGRSRVARGGNVDAFAATERLERARIRLVTTMHALGVPKRADVHAS